MTSQDNTRYVTVEMFNDGMAAVTSRLDAINRRLVKIDQTIAEMRYEIRYNARDIDHLQTSVYWGFAIMGVVVALAGFMIAVAPMLREARQLKQEMCEIARSVVDEAISRALDARKQ